MKKDTTYVIMTLCIATALSACIASRSGNFPAKIDLPGVATPQKTKLGYTMRVEYEEQKTGAVNDIFAKKSGERFEQIAQQSNRFESISATANQPYTVDIKKAYSEANSGLMIVSTILSGAGLILPRFGGTTIVDYTFQVSKAGKPIKTYEYKDARTHEFGWTLFIFAMPFTSSGKVQEELDDSTFKLFLRDAGNDQVFR